MTRSERPPRLAERASYAFDRFMERGTIALILGLGVLSVVIIAAIVGILWLLDATGPYDLPHLLWASLMRTLDPGTMGGDDGDPLFLLGMLSVTLAGIFVISTLIGILATGLQDRLANLRKGRSKVLERDHVVILGWSQQIFAVIGELLVGGAGRRRNSIVVMADRDRVEMETAIRDRVRPPRRSTIVCRTGRGSVLADLAIANPDQSRAIIVLQEEGDDPDVEVLKTILALTGRQARQDRSYRIVAEVRDAASEGIARLVAGHQVSLLLADELIARIIAQTSRQSGLSTVYLELLDFAGHELHVGSLPELAGRTFGEVVATVAGGVVVGIVRDGTPWLAPPPAEVVKSDDRLILLAEDHDSASVAGPAPVDAAAIRSPEPAPPGPERTLVLGWNRRAPAIIRELDQYVAPGSEVLVVSPLEKVREADAIADLRHLTVRGVVASTTQRPSLDELDVPSFAHVIVLCESDDREPEMADARVLLTLLHLRDIQARHGIAVTITSEMLDEADRELAEVAEADDFIVSSRLLSLLLAQIAETPDLAAVFRELFAAQGAEVYLRPAGDYVATDRAVTFATLQAAAQAQGHVALGWRVAARARDQAAQYGVVLNPGRDASVALAPADRVIVVADR